MIYIFKSYMKEVHDWLDANVPNKNEIVLMTEVYLYRKERDNICASGFAYKLKISDDDIAVMFILSMPNAIIPSTYFEVMDDYFVKLTG